MKQEPLKLADGFAPKFGKRGELRQTIGHSGRFHLDRWLPFLVLNRSSSPAESIARRVAINSPAYLIWSPEDENEAAEALEAVLAELRERLGPVLLISVEDGPWEEQAPGSPKLPPFVVGMAAHGGERATAALEALRKAVDRIEIDLRCPEIEIADTCAEPLAGAGGADRICISIPQIHRAAAGGFYPQITHELSLLIGDALLRAAAAFMADGTGAPAHYRSLGRSAFLAAALNGDAKLDSIARSFDFLLSLSPINTTEAMQRFFKDRGDKPPEFRYRPLTIDPDDAKRELYEIDLSLVEDPTLEQLLREKRRELDYQLTMLATRNMPVFRGASLLLYGPVTPQLLNDALSVLDSTPPQYSSGELLPAQQVAAAARELVNRYRSVDARFDAAVEVRDDVVGMLVSGPRLMIGSRTVVAPNRLDPLLAHEISVHLLTYFNGGTQGLSMFRTGLAHYEGVQEGLGVFAEWATGGLTNNRLRLLAGRVVAVEAMIAGAGFIDVYRRLTRDFDFPRESAFEIAARVFRSGGLAKDAIYLKGFRHVLAMVAAGSSLEPFWAGKIAPSHIEATEELLFRGLLRPPLFSPEFLKRDDAQRRIARLRDGLPFDRILQPE